MSRRVRIIGAGRAGLSFARALASVGWDVIDVLGSSDDTTYAASGVDLLLICTPDAAVSGVAATLEPGDAVVAHVAGSLGLASLGSQHQTASVHPLMSLPNAELGAARLTGGGWFAVAGHELSELVVADLGGRCFSVSDADRSLYHATACVASNHLVALLGQVERLARQVGIPADAFLELAAGSLANVRTLGAGAALTGPAARGDDATIESHLLALPEGERPLYQALVDEAKRLAAPARDGST